MYVCMYVHKSICTLSFTETKSQSQTFFFWQNGYNMWKTTYVYVCIYVSTPTYMITHTHTHKTTYTQYGCSSALSPSEFSPATCLVKLLYHPWKTQSHNPEIWPRSPSEFWRPCHRSKCRIWILVMHM